MAVSLLETRRGFVETQRGWQSRLDVAAFDPNILRAVYDLMTACERDIPSTDPVTPVPFDHFLAHAIESPNALPDALFLAKEADTHIGLSGMYRPLAEPGIIYQGLTGVLRDYRGRGIAMALKVQTVRYARANGYREIRTWNDVRNRKMLRINDTLGFVKQPASINYVKTLAP